MLDPVVLRGLRIDPALVLSPMSGVTCSAFRRLLRRLNGPHLGLVITEFVSVEALTRKIARSLQMMKFREEERPIGVQIFGYEIDRMCLGAEIAQETGADLVEVNCGCPAPKVVRKGGGCQLMREPEHVAAMIRALRGRLQVPLTVKMRAGYEAGARNALHIAQIVEGEGADAVVIHGRTRAQGYRGEADWALVREVAAALRIPVFGSGDVVDQQSAIARLGALQSGYPGVAGLYIGRGSLANPLVFKDIRQGGGREVRHNLSLVLSILRLYAELLREDFPEKVCSGRMKQLASQMCRGYEWRKQFLVAGSVDQQLELLDALAGGETRSLRC